MSSYEYFLIFLALAFCGYASYTDLKTQKIRNFCSLGLLYIGTVSQLMACISETRQRLSISSDFSLGAGLSLLRSIGSVFSRRAMLNSFGDSVSFSRYRFLETSAAL